MSASAELERKVREHENELLDAWIENARDMTQADLGSDERIRGVTLLSILRGYRAMRDRLDEIDPDWKPPAQ